MTDIQVKQAIISVSDKRGLEDLGAALKTASVKIISTGGTAEALKKAGVTVSSVSDITGFPEMLDGRVKSLHPRIHGGILARREYEPHMQELVSRDVDPIDMVVVNLYPFAETISKTSGDVSAALENIDIGGPTMVRAAAKNFRGVVIVCDPEDYPALIDELKENDGAISLETRLRLAKKAFAHTAEYDAAISEYYSQLHTVKDELAHEQVRFPERQSIQLSKVTDLRYGENPHQSSALYRDDFSGGPSLVDAVKIQGKALSYNNYMDMEGAWQLASEFRASEQPFCAIIKHANPCGAAYGDSAAQAFKTALSCDPVSAFGGIIAFNCPVDEAAAAEIKGLFAECLIAPEYTDGALKVLSKKKNLRVLHAPLRDAVRGPDIRRISGGVLLADYDFELTPRSEWQTATGREPTEAEAKAMEFAWRVCKHVKSNAIVYTNSDKILGVGAGQMSRVDSATIAASRFYKDEVDGPIVMASDAFFPFRDGLDMGAEAGATAVIQPGGSKRDQEVIEAADEHGIAMVFTGRRHFRH